MSGLTKSISIHWKNKRVTQKLKMIPFNMTEEDMQLWNSSNLTENVSDYLQNYYDYYYEYYHEETTFFVIFNLIRCIQVIATVVANVVTLIVLGKLNYLTNGHVIMVYLAVFDLLVGFYFALEGFISFAPLLSQEIPHWKTMCMIREFTAITLGSCNLITYIMLSVDR